MPEQREFDLDAPEDIVSDVELKEAFRNTNFGWQDPREVLHLAMLKSACGYHQGSTISRILAELHLVMAPGFPSKKGRRYLRTCLPVHDDVAYIATCAIGHKFAVLPSCHPRHLERQGGALRCPHCMAEAIDRHKLSHTQPGTSVGPPHDE